MHTACFFYEMQNSASKHDLSAVLEYALLCARVD